MYFVSIYPDVKIRVAYIRAASHGGEQKCRRGIKKESIHKQNRTGSQPCKDVRILSGGF